MDTVLSHPEAARALASGLCVFVSVCVCYGSIKAIKALSRLYYGSVTALLRLF